MTQEDQSLILSSDKPLEDPEKDDLGYAPFAKALAKGICNMIPTEGIVLGIYGDWGSGKSTAANFILHYLNNSEFLKNEGNQNLPPISLFLNPWWFSGTEGMVKSFFNQLSVALRQKEIFSEEFYENLGHLADLAALAPFPFSGAGKPIAKLMSPKPKSITELKRKIGVSLKKQKRKIIVVIDDIDRLSSTEIVQLFKIIKAVGDLPNIIYLLCFDRQVVIEALKDYQGISGDSYLEKIVQVPFALPLPDKIQLRKMLVDKLDVILDPIDEDLWEEEHWASVLWDVIDPFLLTPRQVTRLINSLMVSYPAVRDKVNPIDFVGLEAIKVFMPKAYDVIKKNPKYFMRGLIIASSGHSENEKVRKFHDAWLQDIEDGRKEILENALECLFPYLEEINDNFTYDSAREISWAEKKRLCSEEFFNIYFNLSLPKGDFSEDEIKILLSQSREPEQLAEELQKLTHEMHPTGVTRFKRFLDVLEYWTENKISESQISGIVKAFYLLGDKANVESDSRGFLEVGNIRGVSRKIHQLFSRIDESKRFEILEKIINQSPISCFMLGQMQKYAIEHGKWRYAQREDLGSPAISLEHFRHLEGVVKEKIEEAVSSGQLINLPDLQLALLVWSSIEENESRPKEWVRNQIQTDEGLIRILEGFLSRGWQHSGRDRFGKRLYTLKSDWLEKFLEPSETYPRTKQILEHNEGLSEMQKTALETFIRDYEAQASDASNEEV